MSNLTTLTGSATSAAERFLEAVESDPTRAWAAFDSGELIASARRLDELPARERSGLPLWGLLVGIKDNIDTVNLPTRYGSAIYADHQPSADAAVVARLRQGGALIAGKTKLAEFAWMHPPDTRNPLAPGRTPGGSSSGSAAAVAAGVVPVALGTQTAGSINRPAAYCGVVGFKPSFGLIPTTGVKPLARSLDTAGLIAENVELAARVFAWLVGTGPARGAAQAPRLAFARTPAWDQIEPEAQAAIERTVRAVGVHAEVQLGAEFEALAVAQQTIQWYEGARSLQVEHDSYPELLSDELREAVSGGLAMPGSQYQDALDVRMRAVTSLFDRFGEIDGLLTPSATGFPPEGVSFTGDPLFSRAWTLAGAPSISLPLAWATDGLPAGLQLVGRPGCDHHLLQIAADLMKQGPPRSSRRSVDTRQVSPS